MTEKKKTKVVTSNAQKKAEKEVRQVEDLEARSAGAEREEAFESEHASEDRVEPADDEEEKSAENRSLGAEDDEEEQTSGDAQCETADAEADDSSSDEDEETSGDARYEAADVEGRSSGDEDEAKAMNSEEGNEAFARESSPESRCAAKVVYSNYSFRGIAGRPSGSHVFISDPAGDVHRAEPLDIMGRRVLLVHRADSSDYDQARFTDEPMV